MTILHFSYSSVTCHGLKFYQKNSVSLCPATCRLLDSSKRQTCDDSPSSLLQVDTPPSGTPIVTIKSTDRDCLDSQKRYQKRQMCIYNVDMTHCPSGVVVNEGSKLDIPTRSDSNCTGDFLMVMYNGQRHRVCGRSWPSELSFIRASNFQLLFWSGQNDEGRGTGFRLQLECRKTSGPERVEPSSTVVHQTPSLTSEEPSPTAVHDMPSLTTPVHQEPSPTPSHIIETSSSGDSL